MKGCSQKDFLCAADSSLMTTVCDGALEVVSLPHSWWVTFLTGLSILACRCCSPLPAMSVSQSARAASLTAAGGGHSQSVLPVPPSSKSLWWHAQLGGATVKARLGHLISEDCCPCPNVQVRNKNWFIDWNMSLSTLIVGDTECPLSPCLNLTFLRLIFILIYFTMKLPDLGGISWGGELWSLLRTPGPV